MRLTTQTDYALRMLMYLATQDGSRTIDEIASAYDISRNHLMKVAQRLAANDFIISQRGRGGGLTLAREPAEINIGAVIRMMENTDQFVECQMGSSNGCIITPVCGLQHMIRDAVDAFLNHLDQFTLEDALASRAEFKGIFVETAI
ncbi:Nitrite-sensitive transcriptional repressor NsrR [hydrothermal vent metagenome]|uniref:Nitrite-sensitive transcriptional repressor NsrR n=1 Tax=hydrothermal vent metagenome TaxID=652676 RepID=A0A3B0RU36_9ZZZZ